MQSKQNDILISIASGIFAGAAIFDVLPESSSKLGLNIAIFWMITGLILWHLQKLTLRYFKRPDFPPIVASALWFNSILEGLVTGLAFGVSKNLGILVLAAMTLHLLPEFFAAIALMKGSGAKNKTSIFVTLTGFAILYASFGITYAFLPNLGEILPILIAMSGGAFLYISLASFYKIKSRSLINIIFFIAGTTITSLFKLLK